MIKILVVDDDADILSVVKHVHLPVVGYPDVSHRWHPRPPSSRCGQSHPSTALAAPRRPQDPSTNPLE